MTKVVTRMHGLNTYQRIGPATEDSTGSIPSTTDDVNIQYVGPLTASATLIALTSMGVSLPDEQFYFRRAYTTVRLVHSLPYPCKIRVLWLKCRKDIAATVAALPSLMTDDAPALTPYVSPTTGDTFRKYFKVTRHKFISMIGGKEYKFTVKDTRYNNRKVNIEVEGDSTNYWYRKGTRLLVWLTHGQICHDISNDPNQDMSYAPSDIVGSIFSYYSGYRMSDDDPISSMDNNMTAPVALNVLHAAPSTQQMVLPWMPANDGTGQVACPTAVNVNP